MCCRCAICDLLTLNTLRQHRLARLLSGLRRRFRSLLVYHLLHTSFQPLQCQAYTCVLIPHVEVTESLLRSCRFLRLNQPICRLLRPICRRFKSRFR